MNQIPDEDDAAAPDVSSPGLPGEAPMDEDAIPEHYRRAFGIVAYTMNRFIIDHMLRATRSFDNDAEAMVLFGVLAHLNVAHMMPPGSRPSAMLDEKGSFPESQPRLRPMRIRDLAQITGRPRETIRRRLERMEATGRVLRVVGGYVLNVATVDPAMRELTVDGVRRFMETARVIDAALQDAERAVAAERSGRPPGG